MDTEPRHRPKELTDAARATLAAQMKAQVLEAKRIGFSLRDDSHVTQQCLVTEMPDSPAGEVSCCGAKDFLIDEVREFTDKDGQSIQIHCASSAILEMTDAPIHMHAATLEYYIVLSGKGRMVLGSGQDERIVNVHPGSIILLQPGQPHGIASDDPEVPIKALLTFSPGLAPISQPDFRDEQILHARTTDRLRELEGREK